MDVGGGKKQKNYFRNLGGLNNTDTPWVVDPSQATDGRNYEYVKTGGIQKRQGSAVINSVADTQLNTLGLAARVTKSSGTSAIRAAGTKIQLLGVSAGSFTNLTEDTTAATSDFFTSEVPVSDTMFVTTGTDVLWLTGGGAGKPKGVYSDTKVTTNGVSAPTGALGSSVASGSGSFPTTGEYFYTISYVKAATSSESNVALSTSATIAATTDEVTIDLTGITGLDTAQIESIKIYRSAVGGSEGFTAGDLAGTALPTDTSFLDNGTSTASSLNIPRAGNTLLDNSELPDSDFRFTTLFKRRLVTAFESTVYISDLDKPESWPLINRIVIPSGGKITGLGIISFTTPTSSNFDEILVIFKDDALWTIDGTGAVSAGLPDFSLKFIDNTGCSSHKSIVLANGYLFWIDDRGIFLWDGAGKPIYISRLIEDYFSNSGEIDKSKLDICWGQFFKAQNEVVWYLSHKIYGEQKFALKLDIRLTLPNVSNTLGERILDGVFIPDTTETAYPAGRIDFFPGQSDQSFFAGDGAGFTYKLYANSSDNTTGIDFEYETNFLTQDLDNIQKSYDKIIVWVESVGDWDLTLDYWADYRSFETDSTTQTLPIGPTLNAESSLWDVAEWDVAEWDNFDSSPRPIVFNLRSAQNNTVGDAIKLRFKQTGADQPILIYGFSIIYSVVGQQKQRSRG